MRLLHEFLTLNDPPGPADLIFVLAGRMDRKRYGLELYRAGFAPRLLLSVDRYEVSKMPAIGFEAAEELKTRRDALPPDQRHFFCEINAFGVQIENPPLRRCNTYGEILGLRAFLEPRLPQRLMVVSSDVHLRRVAVTIRRVFHHVPLDVRYCAVATEDRGYLLRETIKLAAYHVILRLPDWMIARIMRPKA